LNTLIDGRGSILACKHSTFALKYAIQNRFVYCLLLEECKMELFRPTPCLKLMKGTTYIFDTITFSRTRPPIGLKKNLSPPPKPIPIRFRGGPPRRRRLPISLLLPQPFHPELFLQKLKSPGLPQLAGHVLVCKSVGGSISISLLCRFPPSQFLTRLNKETQKRYVTYLFFTT
jgi:hypothetical protein